VDAFSRFIADACRTPPLPEPQVRELLVLAKAGSKAARDELVLSNMRAVVGLASRLASRRVGMDDLVQEGVCGLLVAVDKFNMAADSTFLNYAAFWIYKSMRDAIDADGVVKRSARAVQRGGQRIVTQSIDEWIEVARQDPEDSRSVQLLNILACDKPGVEEIVDATLRADYLYAALAKVPEELQSLLRLRFGLEDGNPRTLTEIALLLGIERCSGRPTQRTAHSLFAEAFRLLTEALGQEP
jgi:RNA polymerase sigma factor (sigma-70 family)